MQAREFEARELRLMDDLEGRFREYMARGTGYTGILDNRILMCAGIFLQWRGMAEVWAVTTALVAEYPLAFHRAISKCLDVLERSMGLWRIQVAIHEDHLVSQNWIQRLGFRLECKKPGYGPDGATYMGFARVRDPKERVNLCR
jgi:hypothetical protein